MISPKYECNDVILSPMYLGPSAYRTAYTSISWESRSWEFISMFLKKPIGYSLMDETLDCKVWVCHWDIAYFKEIIK